MLLSKVYNKDIFFSKWYFVVFKEYKFEFVFNDWIIVYYCKSKISIKLNEEKLIKVYVYIVGFDIICYIMYIVFNLMCYFI